MLFSDVCFQSPNLEKIGGFALRYTKARKARIDLFVVKQLKSTENNFLNFFCRVNSPTAKGKSIPYRVIELTLSTEKPL